jgi:tetratricopeptide (TPR) repeat protein
MDFVAAVDQVIALLHQRSRVTSRTRKRHFQLDDTALEDLTVELIKGQRLAADEDGEVLVWIGAAASPSASAAAPASALAPLAYIPPYLAEKILTSRSALAGERKQITVLFADLTSFLELLADRDPEEATVHARQAVALARTHKERGTEALALRYLGDIALHGAPSQADQATIHYHQALALAAALGMCPLQAHCHRGLGMRYAQTGQQEQARAELSAAIAMYRAMAMTL